MADEYEVERTADRETVAAALRGIADGVAAGSVRLGEEDAVAVEIPDAVELEVEFETDDGERSLEVELEWSEETAVEEFDADADEEDDADTGEEGDVDAAGESGAETPDHDSSVDAGDVVELPVGPADSRESLARFEVFADRAGEWRWRLVHRNGNVIATSGEGYTRKHNARKGVRSVMRNASGAELTED